MTLRKTEPVKNSRKKKQTNTPEARFDREWARVQRLLKRNQVFQSELAALAARVEAEIGAEERAFTTALSQQTEHLLTFLPKKSLTLWQKETLAGWLLENLHILSNHPFADHLDLQGLNESIRDALKLTFGVEDPDPTVDMEHEPVDDEQDDPLGEELGDEDTEEEEAFFERLYEEFSNKRDAEENREREKAQALDQLLKGSSINKLFRQIARVLHPDREQDPAQQKIKHQLMSELIEARDRGDISKIFALYGEHVGQSPLPMIDGDLEKVTQLLKAQAKKLEREKDAQMFANPLHGMIYDKFYAKTEQAVANNIKAHLKGLRRTTRMENNITQSITSLKALKPFLEQRWEEEQLHAIADAFHSERSNVFRSRF